jgi:hypothetical protein
MRKLLTSKLISSAEKELALLKFARSLACPELRAYLDKKIAFLSAELFRAKKNKQYSTAILIYAMKRVKV